MRLPNRGNRGRRRLVSMGTGPQTSGIYRFQVGIIWRRRELSAQLFRKPDASCSHHVKRRC
jgi:hypothetical protein